jgi:hypothetical protein
MVKHEPQYFGEVEPRTTRVLDSTQRELLQHSTEILRYGKIKVGLNYERRVTSHPNRTIPQPSDVFVLERIR